MTIKIPLVANTPAAVSLYGNFGPSDDGASFNAFSHTFTNCGATGRLGPTLDQAKTTYSSATWVNDANAFVVDDGMQIWTVPVDGTYKVTCTGAGGGKGFTFGGSGNYGGSPAKIVAYASLNRGDKLRLVVGQRGLDNEANYVCVLNPGSGAGGSTVFNNTTGELLMVAGGGGGGAKVDYTGNADYAVKHASLETTGYPNIGHNNHEIANAAFGEGSGLGSACESAPPGAAGFNTSGQSSAGVGSGGQGFSQGAKGGDAAQYSKDGGYGGGGSSSQYLGGGGAGFSGGVPGGSPDCHCDRLYSGAGGASYYDRTGTLLSSSTTISLTNDSNQHGSIQIVLQEDDS